MRKALMVMVVLSVVLVGTIAAASAWTAPRVKANIGFAFYTDNQLLPAGEYWFEIISMGNGTPAGAPMAIRSQDNAVFQFLPAMAVGSEPQSHGAYVVFDKIGGNYFLRRVQNGALQGNLPESRSEKEALMVATGKVSGASTVTVQIAAVR